MTLIKQYLNGLQNKNTKISYTITLESFCAFCNHEGIEISDGEYQDVRKGIRAWLAQNGWTDNTARAKLAAIRSFYKWLSVEDWWKQKNPADDIEVVEKPVESLVPDNPTPELCDKVVQYYESKLNRKDPLSYRNYCLVLILRYGGLRVSELLDLRLKDIDLETGIVCIKRSKRNKWRYSRLNGKAVTAIKNWLKYFGMDGEDKLFTVCSQQVKYILTKGAEGAKLSIDDVKLIGHPHAWRHAWTVGLINKGVPLTTIAKMGGWENINMVYYYMKSVHTELISEEGK
jgi:site-specific recombinase XerD